MKAHRGPNDLESEAIYQARAADWRNGAIVYQVLVDRFAPSENLEAKKHLYPEPKKLHPWNVEPTKGVYVPEVAVWSHEIDFWGGDLKSLQSNLDYIENLGVGVLYLNPIFDAFTNHKYNANDFMKIAPEYGTREDLKELADDLHDRGMYLVLDGVFNHMGRKSPYFQEALKDPESPWREFYTFTEDSEFGYLGWWDVENLPEIRVESKRARNYLYARPDSIVQSYLLVEDIDGWRLDVAFDLGEIYNYPEDWFPAIDAVMNMHGRVILMELLKGNIPASHAAQLWQTMIDDSGIEPILKSWILFENHDWPRLKNLFEEDWQEELARIFQFTLPGSVNLYYGGELGMEGGEDPEQRAPMRWDLAHDKNETLNFHKQLIRIRKENPALKYGDFRLLHSEKSFAFMRYTNKVRETVVVLINPTDEDVEEFIQIRYGKIQDAVPIVDLIDGEQFNISAGTAKIKVPAHGYRILKPKTGPSENGYDRYDRLY